MEDLVNSFEQLKVSAFRKASLIQKDVKNVTIGPNSFIKNEGKSIPPIAKVPLKKPDEKVYNAGNDVMPVRQIINDLNLERHYQVQNAVKQHVQKFVDFSKDQANEQKKQWLMKQQTLIDNIQKQERQILNALDNYDKNKLNKHEELLQYYKELDERRRKNAENLEAKAKYKQLLNTNIDKIKKNQIEYRSVYQSIINSMKDCTSNEELKATLGDLFKELRTLPEAMEGIITKCKSGKIDQEEVTNSDNIVFKVKTIRDQIAEGIRKINQKHEKKVVVAPPPTKVDTPTTNTTTASNIANKSCEKESTESLPSEINTIIGKENLEFYAQIMSFYENYTLLLKDIETDDRLKQFRFDCKKAVNIPVNAISAVNSSHLLDKYIKLSNLISGKTVSAGDSQINASKHPQGIQFCMNLLAKKFVLQADLMISSNPDAAFSYASVIISLWNQHPDFGKLLLAHFFKQCPYLVPFYPPKTVDQSNEDYYKSLGYQYNEGQVEKQDKFLKRMTGIMRLYSAILIARPKRDQTGNPYGIKMGWKWFSSVLKFPPRLDITATMLHTFLETAGYDMQQRYGKHFIRLLRIFFGKFMPILKKKDSGGPVTRLEVMLQEYQKNGGRFSQSSCVLPTNFW